MKFATTRVSLLIRLRDHADKDAWSQFAEIYSPLVFHFAQRAGFQESDAADLVQEVMGEVSKSIGSFEYDPDRGRFRSWLYKIAKRTMSRIYDRQSRQPRATGDSQTIDLLMNHPDGHDDIEQMWNREYQKQLLHWAADQIRHQFRESTWKAFWMTSVEERTPQEVADHLGITVGAVYIAKSRVTTRLAEKIREIDDTH